MLKTLLALLLSSLLLSSDAFATSDIFEKATKAATFIHTKIIHGFSEDEDAESSNEGAGFLIDKERGLVMTNAHVAGRGHSEVNLRFYKQHRLTKAEKVFVDPYHDIAILKIPTDSIPEEATELTLDCDYQPRRGEEIFAIGHPERTQFQITRGVVSGEYDDNVDGIFWSTDLVIESGSSGGAAISINTGKVVGISTAGWDESDISLLTKARNACLILDPIKKGLSAKRPLLGFQQMMVDGYLSNRVGLVFDSDLPLKPGDIITSWDHGKTWDIDNTTRFADLLRGYQKPTVEITVKRKEKTHSFEIPVKEGFSHNTRNWAYFTGLTFAETLQEDGNRLVDYYPNKVIRLQTRRLGESEISGIEVRNWAILHSVNGIEVHSIEKLVEILKDLEISKQRGNFIFNAGDVTAEAWRYMFSRDILVKELESNIDYK